MNLAAVYFQGWFVCYMNKMHDCNCKMLQNSVAFERDERAYKKLFLVFYKDLLRFAYSLCKNNEASEEIVSDVMVKVWTMKDELAAINNLKVYLFRAIKNTTINYLTRSRKYTSWDIDNLDLELDSNLYDPEETALQKEFSKKIIATVKELPPKCQMVYKLVREDGFTYREVAAIMNISENTVDRHLNIALRKVTEAMKHYLKG